MWEGLLIFYVTNATNETNVFCLIFMRRLFDFHALLKTQKPYLCIEFQSALKSNQQINLLTYQLKSWNL